MNANRKPTQAAMIKAYLERHGSITAREAMTELGCMRLGARILEMKKDGIPIASTMEAGVNRNGDPVHYKRYTLEGEV